MKEFYTRRGDDGTTGIIGKERLKKHDLRMETIGTLDEVSAVFGLARSSVKSIDVKETLLQLQKQLYKLMGEVAASKELADQFQGVDQDSIVWVEEKVAYYSARTEIPKEFIIPGDTLGGAAISMGRTVVRRAERRVSELLERGDISNEDILKYLNRLSSLCFVMELFENGQSSENQQTLVK